MSTTLPTFLQDSDSLRSRYTGETFQEFIQRVPSLEVIEQATDWHPGAGEDQLAPQNLG